MTDFLRRRDAETVDQHKVRVLLAKEEGNLDIPWKDIAEVFGYNEDYIRRVAKGVKLYHDSGVRTGGISDERYEIMRERVRARDERASINRDIRSVARWEQKIDYLEQLISENGKARYDPVFKEVELKPTPGTAIVMLSDLHIGACFSSALGRYDSTIAKERLEEYRNEVRSIAIRHKLRKAQVVLLGDLISGNIHANIAVSNREDVISQVMMASEMITEFVYEMSLIFDEVKLNSVCGNHSRIARKDDAIKAERLDRVIPWYVKSSLKHIDNVEVIDPVDTTIDVLNVEGKTFYAVHGDYDGFSDSGIKNLVLMTGTRPYGILFAHNHYSAHRASGVIAIQGGSLAGSGDDFTFDHRMISGASQTVVVMDADGMKCIYPVNLDLGYGGGGLIAA